MDAENTSDGAGHVNMPGGYWFKTSQPQAPTQPPAWGYPSAPGMSIYQQQQHFQPNTQHQHSNEYPLPNAPAPPPPYIEDAELDLRL
ncbi:hypothetical protein H0H81_009270 [Sphagnurus paluster]|uniref:Uncharacterized protein n=1 Tax=Sphagnurus paluster TaxID=117069 RepID=A0A9P7K5Q3_9AGAR|nr:hypothetical protein H0H81_009270 [Sphagnurus paluster]